MKTGQYHIVGITETWAREGIFDAELKMEGYVMYRRDRESRGHTRGGGLLLYVRDDVGSHAVSFDGDGSFQEALFVEVSGSSCSAIVGICYRSPASSHDNDGLLIKLMSDAVKSRSSLLIMGDFNFPEIDFQQCTVHAGKDSSAYRFFKAVQDLFLCQHVMCETRYRQGQTPNVLDYVLTTDYNAVDNLQCGTPLGRSDHVCIVFEFLLEMGFTEDRPRKRNYWKGNYGDVVEELAGVDWGRRFEGVDTEESWRILRRVLNKTVERNIPMKRVPVRTRKNSFLSDGTLKLIKNRSVAWNRYKAFDSAVNFENFRVVRNAVVDGIRKDRSKYQLKLINSFKDRPKKFYSYMRGLQHVKDRVTTLQRDDGTHTTTDLEAAEILLKQFQSVFTVERSGGSGDAVKFPILRRIQVPDQFVVTMDEVRKKLMLLKADKSPGPDGIHPLLLRRAADSLCQPLTDIFMKSFTEAVVPRDWRDAVISPIYKKGPRSLPENYRPVSLTSVVCKVMESIVRDRIVDMLNKNGFINKIQHGFVKSRSCLTNLLTVLEDWTKSLDEGEGLDVIYLDYRKAFDKVPHRKLIFKLQSIGVPGGVVRWIESFLKDRRMKVSVGGSESRWAPVTSGVPQGSVLGPLLYLMYVNDLPSWMMNCMAMFADDSKLWRRIRSEEDARSLQRDLDMVEDWNDESLLELNWAKCHLMRIGHGFGAVYTLGRGQQRRVIEQVGHERDLGVIITEDLKTQRQCCEASRKANWVLGMIKRQFHHLDAASFDVLYRSFVRPHLEYSVQAWSPYLRKDIEVLEKVQRRATKMVYSIRKLPYHERLLRLGLTTLERRRRRGDLIETFKILTGREDVDPEQFFQRVEHSHNLRGHRHKLYVQRCRLDIRRHFFSQRVVQDWNSLPDDVVSATSVASFKRRLMSVEEWGIKSC